MLIAILWTVFLAAGWAAFAYLAAVPAGGLVGAWAAVRSLPLVVQPLLWLIFLPWMLGLWVWQLGWPFWIRAGVLAGLLFWSYVISVPPLIQMLRGGR